MSGQAAIACEAPSRSVRSERARIGASEVVRDSAVGKCDGSTGEASTSRPKIRLARSGKKIRDGGLNPVNNGRRQEEEKARPQLGCRRVKGRSRRESGGGEASEPT